MTIYLAPSNPQWLELFLAEREQLLETIGSTAIPGIHAKPVIDIMIGVENLAVVDARFITDLEGLGYEYIQKYEDKMPFRRFFMVAVK